MNSSYFVTQVSCLLLVASITTSSSAGMSGALLVLAYLSVAYVEWCRVLHTCSNIATTDVKCDKSTYLIFSYFNLAELYWLAIARN